MFGVNARVSVHRMAVACVEQRHAYERYFKIGVEDHAGGDASVVRAVDIVRKVTMYRKRFNPTPLQDLLMPEGDTSLQSALAALDVPGSEWTRQGGPCV